jgi:hypothetical protein
MGGNNTEEAAYGGLRPELGVENQVLEPIDIETLQIKLICILANFIWKKFILKAFDFDVASINIADLLPNRICDPGADIEIPDLPILGQKIPDLLSGKTALDTIAEVFSDSKSGT